MIVCRVAGRCPVTLRHVAVPTQIGSAEFAVEHFNTPLVVVLGHSNCGAVCAVLDATQATRPSITTMATAIDRWDHPHEDFLRVTRLLSSANRDV